ncbi:uncharacterized protein ARMOST_06091 [Armillaria ostoyae]|uniref:Heterokaryon incompatibility domain-containing protein n=1 Tax=Armillaria ostoyae TaxID=47428 RepID=A0A284R242_ARMOS|nr:uncharacterized protein ARMOST_06091 [Armillaria ostoyae]
MEPYYTDILSSKWLDLSWKMVHISKPQRAGWSPIDRFPGLDLAQCGSTDFSLGFNSDRSWFRRAWTLQEVGATGQRIEFGGETGDDSISMTFRKQLESSATNLQQIGGALLQMQKRVSTNPMDRVAGLAYLLNTKYIPIYDAEQSEESAWVALVNAMVDESRMSLFFCYPEPGNGSKCWRASWEQVMNTTFLSLDDVSWDTGIGRTDETDVDWYQGPCIDSVIVWGLADTSIKESPRRGKLIFIDDTKDLAYTCNILADHQYSIPNDSYTLIGCERHTYHSRHIEGLSKLWVVGRKRPDGKFEKLSVVRVDRNQGWNFERFWQPEVKMVVLI